MKKPPVRGGQGISLEPILSPAEQRRRALEHLEVVLATAGHPSPESEARRLFNLNLDPVLACDSPPVWTGFETQRRDCCRQISKRWPKPGGGGGHETGCGRCFAPHTVTRGARC